MYALEAGNASGKLGQNEKYVTNNNYYLDKHNELLRKRFKVS